MEISVAILQKIKKKLPFNPNKCLHERCPVNESQRNLHILSTEAQFTMSN